MSGAATALEIPRGGEAVTVEAEGRGVRLTHLDKPFWPELGLVKADLLAHYAALAPTLLPHLRDRPVVMKRYPDGWRGKHFFMKRTPKRAPEWVRTCAIEHGSGNVIDFALVNDLPTLLWMVNLGCIDLNPWYVRCDDVRRPDQLVLDLDPVPPAGFDEVRRASLRVRQALQALGLPGYPKTTGSRGLHVYVPLRRTVDSKEAWTFAKALARALERAHPDELTAVYRKADRPPGRVLVDYNQNAWNRTLAAVYSVRPVAGALVSTPVEWVELEAPLDPAAFRLGTAAERVASRGDLWAPLTRPDVEGIDLRPHLPAARGGRLTLESRP